MSQIILPNILSYHYKCCSYKCNIVYKKESFLNLAAVTLFEVTVFISGDFDKELLYIQCITQVAIKFMYYSHTVNTLFYAST